MFDKQSNICSPFEIKILDFHQFSGKEKAVYKQMVHAQYRSCLSGQDPLKIKDSELLIIGAFAEGQPIGILLGAFRSLYTESEIYDLHVISGYPYSDVSQLLIKEFEGYVKSHKAPLVKVTYQLESPYSNELISMLGLMGWSTGNLLYVKCYFDAVNFNPPWLHQTYPLPKSCEQFFWKDLKNEERTRLEYLIKQRAIPLSLSPFAKEKHIDWNTSLGLRHEEEVVGWIINLRESNDLIEFKSFFVFSSFYSLGYALRLLTESIHLVQKKPPKEAMFEVHMNVIDNRWLKFVKERLIPYAKHVDRFYFAWKEYTPSS